MYNTKLLILAEEVLNELQGISFDARVWAPIIRNYIQLSRKPAAHYIDIYGKNISPEPANKEILINGKEYPKEYKVFPIDYIHLTINPKFGNGGAYDENKNGYDNNHKYHAYFIFGNEVKNSSVDHELKHAFEDFKKISNGRPGIKQDKEAINLFSGDFEKFMMSSDRSVLYPISTMIEGLYYTSKLERSAYAETVYDEPLYAEIIKHIKSLMQLCSTRHIFQNYKPEILERKWKQYKENYHIPVTDKFNNYKNFIEWACDEINYKGNKTLKKLYKVKYFGQESKKEGSK